MGTPTPHYDLAIVGAGIVGLAHALAAIRIGKRVIIIDRDAQANGASIRNFGFVTVTGQQAGAVWRRARRSRDVWAQIAGPASIAIEQTGLVMVARRPEALAVIEAFFATEMGHDCALLNPTEVDERYPMLRPARCAGALVSNTDLRVESRTAIPALAAWLGQQGVVFQRSTAVHHVETGRVETSRGTICADAIIVCPGDDLTTLFPARFAEAGVTRCKLQMLRLAAPGWRLPSAVMSDLGLVRYLGYAELPQAGAIKAVLEREQPAHLANGVHLIVVQSADGSLIVGDSHHYAATPDPFASAEVEALILDEFAAIFGAPPPVIDRWTGSYASAARHSLVTTPARDVRLVTVTSGTGASTSFALAEEVIAELYGITTEALVA